MTREEFREQLRREASSPEEAKEWLWGLDLIEKTLDEMVERCGRQATAEILRDVAKQIEANGRCVYAAEDQ